MNKRALSFLLVFALLMTLMPLSVFAYSPANGANASDFFDLVEVTGTRLSGGKFIPEFSVKMNLTSVGGSHQHDAYKEVYYIVVSETEAADLGGSGNPITTLATNFTMDYLNPTGILDPSVELTWGTGDDERADSAH